MSRKLPFQIRPPAIILQRIWLRINNCYYLTLEFELNFHNPSVHTTNLLTHIRISAIPRPITIVHDRHPVSHLPLHNMAANFRCYVILHLLCMGSVDQIWMFSSVFVYANLVDIYHLDSAIFHYSEVCTGSFYCWIRIFIFKDELFNYCFWCEAQAISFPEDFTLTLTSILRKYHIFSKCPVLL